MTTVPVPLAGRLPSVARSSQWHHHRTAAPATTKLAGSTFIPLLLLLLVAVIRSVVAVRWSAVTIGPPAVGNLRSIAIAAMTIASLLSHPWYMRAFNNRKQQQQQLQQQQQQAATAVVQGGSRESPQAGHAAAGDGDERGTCPVCMEILTAAAAPSPGGGASNDLLASDACQVGACHHSICAACLVRLVLLGGRCICPLCRDLAFFIDPGAFAALSARRQRLFLGTVQDMGLYVSAILELQETGDLSADLWLDAAFLLNMYLEMIHRLRPALVSVFVEQVRLWIAGRGGTVAMNEGGQMVFPFPSLSP
jgi:Zinc finger, C3HC4 type (RING finger)